jgi:hypothetical protein
MTEPTDDPIESSPVVPQEGDGSDLQQGASASGAESNDADQAPKARKKRAIGGGWAREEEATEGHGAKPKEEKESISRQQRPQQANAAEAGLFRDQFDSFWRFIGDYVGGDKYDAERGQQFINPIFNLSFGQSGDTLSPSKTDPGVRVIVEFAALESTFVQLTDCEGALQLLRQNNALIISGMRGSGRHTLAYYLLHWLELSHKVGIRQLSSASILLDLEEDSFGQVEEKRAYLLCPAVREDLLGRRDLDRLVQRIKQKSSYLIVLWPEGLPVPYGISWHVRLAPHDLPLAKRVLCSHLEYLLRGQQPQVPQEQLDTLLEHAEMCEILQEATSLKRVVHWAGFIAGRIQAGSSAQKVVDECHLLRAQWLRQDARDMLVNVQSQAHLCMLIAAAAMSDIHIDYFGELADSLYKELGAHMGKRERKLWKQFWSGPRSHWLHVAHAHTVSLGEWIEGRRIRVDVMRISPEAMSIPLIDVFWDEYSRFRDGFLKWLEASGHHKNFRVRLAAARTLGILQLRDPAKIEERVIMPWILKEDILLQEAAAMSLAMAAGRSSSTARSVLARLEGWVEDDNTRPRVLFASAIIYAWLGMDNPQEFIRGMDRLVKSRDVWVLDVQGRSATLTDTRHWRLSAVRFAFQRFLQLGNFEPADYVALLRKMLEWIEGRSRIQRRITRETFVDMMLVDEAIEIGSWNDQDESPAPSWPILLRIMQCSDRTPRLAAHLFEHTEPARGTWLASLAGIKRLVIFAGKQTEARPALQDFLYAIFRYGEHLEVKKQLERRLYHWARTCESASHPAPYSKHLLVWLYDKDQL